MVKQRHFPQYFQYFETILTMKSSAKKPITAVAAEESDSDQFSGSAEHENDNDSDIDLEEELGSLMAPSASSSTSSSATICRARGRQYRNAATGRDRAEFTIEHAEEVYEMEGRQIGDKCDDKYKGMMVQMAELKLILGCRKEDVGSHSIRKASLSYRFGQRDSPNIHTVPLHVSLGAYYIHESDISPFGGNDTSECE